MTRLVGGLGSSIRVMSKYGPMAIRNSPGNHLPPLKHCHGLIGCLTPAALPWDESRDAAHHFTVKKGKVPPLLASFQQSPIITTIMAKTVTHPHAKVKSNFSRGPDVSIRV